MLRQKPSSLLKLLWCGPVLQLVASLVIRYTYLDSVERLLFLSFFRPSLPPSSRTRCPNLMLCPSITDVSWLSRGVQGMLCNPSVFNPKSLLPTWRKQEIFLRGRPTDLMSCRESTVLMRLKVDPTQDRKATIRILSGRRNPQVPGVYSFSLECSQLYIGQICRSVDTRLEGHFRNICARILLVDGDISVSIVTRLRAGFPRYRGSIPSKGSSPRRQGWLSGVGSS
jgi:hypothetical protein